MIIVYNKQPLVVREPLPKGGLTIPEQMFFHRCARLFSGAKDPLET